MHWLLSWPHPYIPGYNTKFSLRQAVKCQRTTTKSGGLADVIKSWNTFLRPEKYVNLISKTSASTFKIDLSTIHWKWDVTLVMKYVFVKDRINHEACTMLVIISDRVVGLKNYRWELRVVFRIQWIFTRSS